MPRSAQQSRKVTARKPRSKREPLNYGSLPARIGPQHLATLNKALRWLVHELRVAAGHHRGRDSASHAVEAVTEFLMLLRTVNDKGLHMPLALLADALVSLDDNVVQSMLKPVRRSGRAPASAGRQSMKGAAAYVVRRLQDIGADRTKACKLVAAKLAECGVKRDRGSGELTARTIREWCDAISAGVGQHGAARLTFDALLAEPLPRNTTQQMLLDRLAVIVGKVRASEML